MLKVSIFSWFSLKLTTMMELLEGEIDGNLLQNMPSIFILLILGSLSVWESLSVILPCVFLHEKRHSLIQILQILYSAALYLIVY